MGIVDDGRRAIGKINALRPANNPLQIADAGGNVAEVVAESIETAGYVQQVIHVKAGQQLAVNGGPAHIGTLMENQGKAQALGR